MALKYENLLLDADNRYETNIHVFNITSYAPTIVPMLYDTGAGVTALPRSILDENDIKYKPTGKATKTTGYYGKSIMEVIYTIPLIAYFDKWIYDYPVILTDDDSGILGIDFLSYFKYITDHENMRLELLNFVQNCPRGLRKKLDGTDVADKIRISSITSEVDDLDTIARKYRC